MTFGELMTNIVVPFGGAVAVWYLRRQNIGQSKQIAEVHVLVNSQMTDMKQALGDALHHVAVLSKALSERDPHDVMLAQQAVKTARAAEKYKAINEVEEK